MSSIVRQQQPLIQQDVRKFFKEVPPSRDGFLKINNNPTILNAIQKLLPSMNVTSSLDRRDIEQILTASTPLPPKRAHKRALKTDKIIVTDDETIIRGKFLRIENRIAASAAKARLKSDSSWLDQLTEENYHQIIEKLKNGARVNNYLCVKLEEELRVSWGKLENISTDELANADLIAFNRDHVDALLQKGKSSQWHRPDHDEPILSKFPTTEKSDKDTRHIKRKKISSTDPLLIDSRSVVTRKNIRKQLVSSLAIEKKLVDTGKFTSDIAKYLSLNIVRIIHGVLDQEDIEDGIPYLTPNFSKKQSLFSFTPPEKDEESDRSAPESESEKGSSIEYGYWVEMLSKNDIMFHVTSGKSLGCGGSKNVEDLVSFNLKVNSKNEWEMQENPLVLLTFEEKTHQEDITEEYATSHELYQDFPGVVVFPPTAFLPDMDGEDNSFLWKQTKYVPLIKLIKNGGISNDRLLAEFIHLIKGLAIMHNEKWVHRDIKPDNIFCEVLGDVNLFFADFGMAQKQGNSSSIAEYSYWDLLSRKGIVLQTTDIHALIVTLFELIFPSASPFMKAGRTPKELLLCASVELIYELINRTTNSVITSDFNDIIHTEMTLKIKKFRHEIKQNIADYEKMQSTLQTHSETIKNLNGTDKNTDEKGVISTKAKIQHLQKICILMKEIHKKKTNELLLHIDPVTEILSQIEGRMHLLLKKSDLKLENKICLLEIKERFILSKSILVLLKKLVEDSDRIRNYMQKNPFPNDEQLQSTFLSKLLEDCCPMDAKYLQVELENTLENLIKTTNEIEQIKHLIPMENQIKDE